MRKPARQKALMERLCESIRNLREWDVHLGKTSRNVASRSICCCVNCDNTDDRDVNAAKNILKRGIAFIGWEVGNSSRPDAPEGVQSFVAAAAGHNAEQSMKDDQAMFDHR